MKKMSEYGDIDDFFEEFFKLARQIFAQSAGWSGHQSESESRAVQRSEPDEVIIGPKEITYLLEAPGYTPDDFLVSIFDDTIEVKTREYMWRKELGSTVYPESAVTTYRNGVLSVRIKRRDP